MDYGKNGIVGTSLLRRMVETDYPKFYGLLNGNLKTLPVLLDVEMSNMLKNNLQDLKVPLQHYEKKAK